MGAGERAKGNLLALIGILVVSPDVLLIRLMDLDHWTIAFWRGVLTTIGMCAIVAVTARMQKTRLRTLFVSVGLAGVLVCVLVGVNNLLFVVSVTHTHAADTLVILTSTPLFAAAFSRIFLKDRIPPETWAASIVALGAIALVFSGSLSTGGAGGDLAALSAALLLATVLTIIRRCRARSMLPALVGSGAISALAVAALADLSAVTGPDASLLVINGLVIIPLSLALLMVAPRYIRAPDVALIFLLETVLGPLWVWVALGEVPPTTTIIGGGVLVVTLALHSWYQSVSSRPLATEGVSS
jgi:drug/metabolite transporter (DMT)-like permease